LSGERQSCSNQLQGPPYPPPGSQLRRWRNLQFKPLRLSLALQNVLPCSILVRHCSIATKQMLRQRQHLHAQVVALHWQSPSSQMPRQDQTVRVANSNQQTPPQHSSDQPLHPTVQHWLQLTSALARGPTPLRRAGLWAGASVVGHRLRPTKLSRVVGLPASSGTCLKGRLWLLGRRPRQHGASRGSRCQTAAERSDSVPMRPHTSVHQVASHPLARRLRNGHWRSSSVLMSNEHKCEPGLQRAHVAEASVFARFS